MTRAVDPTIGLLAAARSRWARLGLGCALSRQLGDALSHAHYERRPRSAARAFAVITAMALVSVTRADPPPQVNTASESSPAGSTGTPLPQVTIEAQREVLERRVRTFVSHSLQPAFDVSLVRWSIPVCPLVVGMQQSTNEYVATRVRQVATSAGARTASQPCEANLVILISAQPEAVLQAWYKKDFHVFEGFEGASDSTINAFIKTPRLARVWYNIHTERPHGMSYSFSTAAPFNPASPRTNQMDDATRTVFAGVRAFTTVIVAFDSTRLKGIKVRQLADYSAMVGLAQIQNDVDVGTAPSILRVFAAPDDAKPEGVSDWDAAFLKALYGTNQQSTMQKGEIARRMVSDIGH